MGSSIGNERDILLIKTKPEVRMQTFPISPCKKVGGMVWFARMLDKIRLHNEERLPPEYVPFLGKGFDGRCVRYLQIDYSDLVKRVFEAGTDEEVLRWCFKNGRSLSEEDVEVWNGFISKRGLRDRPDVIADLEDCKATSELSHRTDIDTYFHYNDVDENRLP